jgi:hypothetical protein
LGRERPRADRGVLGAAGSDAAVDVAIVIGVDLPGLQEAVEQRERALQGLELQST